MQRHTSLHTNMVPKTTCKPSKKLSPTMMTCAPPLVQPSLGEIALMHGVAIGKGGYMPVIKKN